ncbi:hypothetical protein BV375_04910 [Nostoc sp. 106C]|nr:hypothetical protein BV375_04910 [Nostoc sp. 106C]
MDEVEYLCDAFGSLKPGCIGIMDAGKLISLVTLQQLRTAPGEGLVMKQQDVAEVQGDSALCWEYLFFPTLEAANIYLEQQPNKIGMMVLPCYLKNIFVDLTGRQLD